MDNENKSEQNHVSASNSAPKPRAKSTAADVTWWGIMGATFVAYVALDEKIKKFFKETGSDWTQVKEGDKFLTQAKKSLLEIVDPKLWKSNVSTFSMLIGGVLIADYAKHKVAANAYQKNRQNSPSFEPEVLKEIASEVIKTDNTESITDVEHEGKLEQLNKEQTLSP